MSGKLKAYRLGNLDGTFAALVAAPNQKAAAHLMGTTVGEFRRHGGHVSTDPALVALALSELGKVWYRRLAVYPEPAWEAGRRYGEVQCPPYRTKGRGVTP